MTLLHGNYQLTTSTTNILLKEGKKQQEFILHKGLIMSKELWIVSLAHPHSTINMQKKLHNVFLQQFPCIDQF